MEAHTILHRITADWLSVEPSGDGLLVRWGARGWDDDLYLGDSILDTLVSRLGGPIERPATLVVSYLLDGGRVRTTREITAPGAVDVQLEIDRWAQQRRRNRSVDSWVADLAKVHTIRRIVTTSITAERVPAEPITGVAGPDFLRITTDNGSTRDYRPSAVRIVADGPDGSDGPFAMRHLAGFDVYLQTADSRYSEWETAHATAKAWAEAGGQRVVDLTGYVKDVTITFAPDAVNTEAVEGVLADTAMFVPRWHVVPPEQSWDDLLDDVAALPCEHTCHIGATDLYRLVRAAMRTVEE